MNRFEEQRFGNYRLLESIGTGTFADVYLGEHIHSGVSGALKILRTQLSNADGAQFLHKAAALTHLRHPYIVPVQEYGLLNGTPFLVMDYIPGGSLRQHHPRGISVELSDVVHYVTQIAAALQYAHNCGMLHGDVRPENMLVNRDNEIMLSDVGLSAISPLSGSIAYTAPERLRGQPCPASDQYALALLVYEWLSGIHPFHGTFAEIAARQRLIAPRPLYESVPDIPLAVAEVVHIALDKNPNRRFVTVRAFADALEQASEPVWYDAPDIPTQITASIRPISLVASTPVHSAEIGTGAQASLTVATLSPTPAAQSPASPSTGAILKVPFSVQEATRPFKAKRTLRKNPLRALSFLGGIAFL